MSEASGVKPRSTHSPTVYRVGFIGEDPTLLCMDKENAREILDGGRTNSLKSSGSLVNDPSVVVQLLFDGEEFHTTFGNYGLKEDELDYAVHRAKDVTLREKEEYYANNLVEADVYTLDDGTVNVERFEATPNRWEETKR